MLASSDFYPDGNVRAGGKSMSRLIQTLQRFKSWVIGIDGDIKILLCEKSKVLRDKYGCRVGGVYGGDVYFGEWCGHLGVKNKIPSDPDDSE